MNISDLPLVIAGPILRRVDSNSVTIWIALKEPCNVQLHIRDDEHLGPLFSSLTENGNTNPIGKNLHIACITAVGSADSLLRYRNKKNILKDIYFYDLQFGGFGANSEFSEITYLRDTNVLKKGGVGMDISNFTYREVRKIASDHVKDMPSFVVPSNNIETLSVLHGSCRKAHGEGRDALVAGDKAIDGATRSKRLRPQIMCLTGDQIYADDVADSMLAMVMDKGNMLFDGDNDNQKYEEVFPVTFVGQDGVSVYPFNGQERPDLSVVQLDNMQVRNSLNLTDPSNFQYDDSIEGNNLQAPDLRPGHRQDFINLSCGFTLDQGKEDEKQTGKSHLVTFKEFCTMYLFAFSDVLWPGAQTGLYPFIREDQNQDVPNENSPSTFSDRTVDIIDLINYKKGLREVRRLFASVSTYMTFDDHELTDDVFLNLDWTRRVLGDYNIISPNSKYGRESGKRLLTNALTSYAIFQGCGNVSFNMTTDYVDADSPTNQAEMNQRISGYRSIFQEVADLSDLDKTNSDTIGFFNNLQNLVLPTWQDQDLWSIMFNEGENNEEVKNLEQVRIESPMKWYFNLNIAEEIKFIFLDIRCSRSYPFIEPPKVYAGNMNIFLTPDQADKKEKFYTGVQTKGPAALISWKSRKDQLGLVDASGNDIPHVDIPYVFVISGAPIFGLDAIEGAIDGIAIPHAITHISQITASEAYDREAWGYNRAAFEDLIREISVNRSVTILSGDVHYSFMVEVPYAKKVGNTYERSRIVQSVSSSLRNENAASRITEVMPELTFKHFGWDESYSNYDDVTVEAVYFDSILNLFVENASQLALIGDNDQDGWLNAVQTILEQVAIVKEFSKVKGYPRVLDGYNPSSQKIFDEFVETLKKGITVVLDVVLEFFGPYKKLWELAKTFHSLYGQLTFVIKYRAAFTLVQPMVSTYHAMFTEDKDALKASAKFIKENTHFFGGTSSFGFEDPPPLDYGPWTTARTNAINHLIDISNEYRILSAQTVNTPENSTGGVDVLTKYKNYLKGGDGQPAHADQNILGVTWDYIDTLTMPWPTELHSGLIVFLLENAVNIDTFIWWYSSPSLIPEMIDWMTETSPNVNGLRKWLKDIAPDMRLSWHLALYYNDTSDDIKNASWKYDTIGVPQKNDFFDGTNAWIELYEVTRDKFNETDLTFDRLYWKQQILKGLPVEYFRKIADYLIFSFWVQLDIQVYGGKRWIPDSNPPRFFDDERRERLDNATKLGPNSLFKWLIEQYGEAQFKDQYVIFREELPTHHKIVLEFFDNYMIDHYGGIAYEYGDTNITFPIFFLFWTENWMWNTLGYKLVLQDRNLTNPNNDLITDEKDNSHHYEILHNGSISAVENRNEFRNVLSDRISEEELEALDEVTQEMILFQYDRKIRETEDPKSRSDRRAARKAKSANADVFYSKQKIKEIQRLFGNRRIMDFEKERQGIAKGTNSMAELIFSVHKHRRHKGSSLITPTVFDIWGGREIVLTEVVQNNWWYADESVFDYLNDMLIAFNIDNYELAVNESSTEGGDEFILWPWGILKGRIQEM